MSGRLNDKVVVISGGASGIGAAHAEIFAREGAKVIIGDLQEEMGQDLVDTINQEGGDSVFIPLDVSKEESWNNIVTAAVSRYGKVTSLINNAGIGSGKDTESETVEGWDKCCAVNQTGVWLGMKVSIPEMLKAGGGSIVNISSVYGIIGSVGMIAYHASKGAVRLMTKAAALEYATKNIRINSVHPGIIETPLAMTMPEKYIEVFKGKTPMGRLVKWTPLSRQYFHDFI
ncbi:MAG: SDR family NAD(P)-dependent oxidoreductase [Pseudomonadales bacterium]|nr:SDR family NAD(P)-dependent oxidoreductase [Pseudomonadales bacterium]